MSGLPHPRSCSLHLICSVPDPHRMAPRPCQRPRIRKLRPGRTRTFAPASAQHNIPIDGLFSFTLPHAIQNTWYLPAAFWFRYKQQVLPHVGTSEAVGNGRRYTAPQGSCATHSGSPVAANHFLEAMQEQQDWEDSPPPRRPGDADFQLSPTQPVVRRSGNTEM